MEYKAYMVFFKNKNSSPLHWEMHCTNLVNWSSGSGEDDFKISLMYFRYFIIISLWKWARPFIWTNLNPFHPMMLYAKFGWNWPSGCGEKNF